MIRNLIRRVGHRGAALLFFALLDEVYAYSLFNPPPSSQYLEFVRGIAPFQVWACLWAAAGAICLISAFRKDDRWGFAAAMAIKMMWGMLYVYGIFIDVERSYLGAAIWLCLAGWIAIISSWPAPPEGVTTWTPRQSRQ